MVQAIEVGTRVTSSDGKHVGDLRHIVLDRDSLKATHLVIDIGPLRAGREVFERGLAGDYDRMVVLADLASVTDEGITLRLTKDEFMERPAYTSSHFEQPHDLTPGQIDLSDAILLEQTLAIPPITDPAIWLVPTLHRGRNERDIAEGTPVWREEPHEKIGEVDQVLLRADGRLDAFIIRRGFLGHDRVLLPGTYVRDVLDDIVHVQLTDAQLGALTKYIA